MAQTSLLPDMKLKARTENDHPNTEPLDETAVHDIPSTETKLLDLNGDTEVLDIPFFADSLRAQMVDDSEKEVLRDSDDEEIQRNKVLTAINEMPCDGPERTMGHKSGGSPNEDKKQLDPANNLNNLGFSMSWGSPVAVSESIEAICLAINSLTDMGSNNGHCSDHVDPRHEEAPVMKNKISRLKNQRTIDTNVDAINLGHSSCVPEPARLSYIESQEHGGSSQAALDFVDHYLSVNDVNLPQEVKIGNINKLTSPPALSRKGFRNLAMGANLRTKASDSQAFEWDENQSELFLGWKSHRARSVSMPKLANDLKFQEERKICEKFEDFNLNLVDSRIIVHESNQISELRKAAEKASRMQSCKEMGEQFNTEPMRKQQETSSSETGFDTQMAAEAIDALLYAPPPSHDPNTDQGTENILEYTSESEVGKKVAMDFSFPDSGSSGSEAGETENRMQSSKELGKQFDAEPLKKQPETNSNEWDIPEMDADFDTQLAAEAIEALLYAPSPSHNANTDQGLVNILESTSKSETLKKVAMDFSFPDSDSSCSEVSARYFKSIKRSDNKVTRNKSTSIQNDSKNKVVLDLSVEVTKTIQREKSLTDKYTRDVNPKSRASKTSSKVITQKAVEEFSEKEDFRYNRNLSSSKAVCCDYEGKRGSSLDTDKLSGEREKRSKLGFYSSVEVAKSEANRNKKTSPDIDTSMSNLKSNPWIFPKKERTFYYVSHFSIFPSTFTSSIALDDENCKGSYKGCPIKSEGEMRTPCLSSIVKRKVRSAQNIWHSSKKTCAENRKVGKFGEESLESVVITGQMDHVKSAKVKASEKSSKFDKVDPTLFEDGKENKDNELPNVYAKTTLPTSGEDYKQQYKRNSSRPTLLKELTRLGFAESLPDFLSKDLRRRRNKSNIRVLFCPRLDYRTIKKQKKIMVRLGISVASDSSDATHFVTDKFVRTRNMLETMALGKPVVTHLWLESCLQAKCFVDEKNYILQDSKMEKELGFSMVVSLARAKEHPLLKYQRVLVTPNAKPSREMIENLVKKVRGQVVKGSQKLARKDKVISNDVLILSCEEDCAACVPFLEEGIAVYSSELLLTGIVIQKLEYEKHRLFKDHIQSQSRTIH